MIRTYGNAPFKVAVIHGGPGAPGYMAPVARELKGSFGVIEPIQTAKSLKGQIKELHDQMTSLSHDPICLVGSSWGATLALFYAANYSKTVNKVILVGSCVFDVASSNSVKTCRMARMSKFNQTLYAQLLAKLGDANKQEKDGIFARLAECLFESDTFDPISHDLEILRCEMDTYQSVWQDFQHIRDKEGALQAIFSKIEVPVVNIHGDYDPHPIEGIQPFLESCLSKIKLYSLKQCGHYPWIERFACKPFFEILNQEII